MSAMSFLTDLWCHKQNGHGSVGTLYREPLGEKVVHYDNVYKIKKGLKWGKYSIIESIWAYFCTDLRFSVCFPTVSHFTSLWRHLLLLLLSNDSISKTVRAKPTFYNVHVEVSFVRTLVLIITSLRISLICMHAHSPWCD